VVGFPGALQIHEQKSPNGDQLLHLHVAINEGAIVDMVSLEHLHSVCLKSIADWLGDISKIYFLCIESTITTPQGL
jgi:hypothetical protein